MFTQNKETTAENNDDGDDSDDEFFYASTISTGKLCKAWLVTADHSVTIPPPPQPSRPLESLGIDDEGIGSEVTRLQGQCRPIRSVHQLMKTELWARNRMLFGRVEQRRIMKQVSYAATQPQQHHLQQFHTKTTAPTAYTAKKVIILIRPDAKAPCTAKAPGAACTESHTAAVSTPLPHPLVLPDYSDEEFFISCDEEEDDDDDDDDEEFEDTNCTWSSEEDTADRNDCDEEPVLSVSINSPVASSTNTWRYCRTHRPIKSVSHSAAFTMKTFSSTESEAVQVDSNELKCGGVITTETIATSPSSTVRVADDLNKWRQCMLPRRCSSSVVDAANRPRPSSVVDVQVQCDDGKVVADHIISSSNPGIDGQLQLQQLHRDVDNSRLNDMLLRFQEGTRPSDCSVPGFSPSSVHEETVLSAEDVDVVGGDGDHQRCLPGGVEQQLQLQLTGIRKRILGDEHRVLDFNLEDREDPFNDAVRHMDHEDFINVTIPQVVERHHRALMLLQHRLENVAAN